MIPLLSCILSVFLSDDSLPSLCKYVHTASVLKTKLSTPPLPDIKWGILSCSLPFFKQGILPMHSVLLTTKLFLNFSPSYSLTSHNSGFFPQRFPFNCTSSLPHWINHQDLPVILYSISNILSFPLMGTINFECAFWFTLSYYYSLLIDF